MSIGICGKIILLNDNISEHIELAYLIQKSATDNRIGCKMGGNVSHHVYDLYAKYQRKSGLLFEIMDSPVDNFAEDLFFPTIESDDYESEFYTKINSSLKRVYNLFKAILGEKVVECIYSDFNYLFGYNEKPIDVKIDDLCEYITSMYIKKNYYTPVLCMRIIR